MPTVGLDAQISIELKQQDKNRIRLGRTRIDEYRASHATMYVDGVKVSEHHHEYLLTLLSLLRQDAWFTGLDDADTLKKAFSLSDVLSARDLGYDLPIDVYEGGDPQDIADYEARWK